MLIVITHPTPVAKEATIINSLFDEGMDVLHLRKPDATAEELKELFAGIQTKYHSQIALHQHHRLAGNFDIKRLHYTEQHRKKTDEAEWLNLKERGFILSSSIHKIEDAETLSLFFAYAFFGPVFNSISKSNYSALTPSDFMVPATETKLVAIGGMDKNNITKALEMGFDGVAILGAVWQNADPLKSFKNIQKACSSIVR